MNTELITALDILEKEKKISKKVLIEAIENSLLAACKNHFGKNENFTAKVDPKTGDFKVTAAKEVVETVEDSVTQISLADAQMISPKYNIGDTINVEIKSAEFGRIAVQNSKSAILQKIREEERQAVYNEYHAKEKDIVTGIVSRYAGNNLVINLGRADAILSEADMVKGEKYKPNDRIKVYVTEVKTEKKEVLKVKSENGVIIQGASGLLMRIAKCCNPVPGDEIEGYITKGRGIAIHRSDCNNIKSQEGYEQRLIEVEWDERNANKSYLAEIDIYGLNRSGLLNDVLQILSNTTKSIATVNAQPTKDMKFANIHVSFEIANLIELTGLVDKIKIIPDVYSVKRTNG